MPITTITKDPENLTMTVEAEFAAPLRRVWDAYVDPRQIERFWGPPEWPATFTRHDMAAGGRSNYYMSGPDGERSHGYWQFLDVQPGRSFEVLDGFAGADGTPDDSLPNMRMVFTFEEAGETTRLVTTTWFNSAEQLQQLVDMGMEEGTRAAMSQIDQVLADLTSFARDAATIAQLIGDTQVRVSRIIRGTTEQVWRAHHEPELMKQWLLGPDGWQMVVCEIAREVGDTHRTEWVDANGENGFGFTGQMLEVQPGVREVTSEQMIGTDGPPSRNELTLTPVDGGTLLSLLITYPSAEVREIVLGTGMTDGMEASYARLEAQLAA
ncbi:SRPBCC family protein [Propionibacteriaceae bacterium Y1923]|uniref:SRPBCC family protein n=1 Tax=Aestuariimicrobium sp. Y1814 TaxID=3418742 RepID=UPI003C16E264